MDEHKDASAAVARLSSAWSWKVIRFESIPILVLLFALFYSNGYAYLETYHDGLGMPLNRLGYDSYQFVVYGGIDVLVKVAAILIAMAAVAILTCLMYFMEDPYRVIPATPVDPTTRRHRLSRRLTKSYIQAKLQLLGTLLLIVLAFGAWALWMFTVYASAERGKLKAYEEIRDCKPSTLQLKNLDVVTACVVGESDDTLYLIDKHTQDGEIVFQERRIPKDSLRSTTGPVTTLKKPD